MQSLGRIDGRSGTIPAANNNAAAQPSGTRVQVETRAWTAPPPSFAPVPVLQPPGSADGSDAVHDAPPPLKIRVAILDASIADYTDQINEAETRATTLHQQGMRSYRNAARDPDQMDDLQRKGDLKFTEEAQARSQAEKLAERRTFLTTYRNELAATRDMESLQNEAKWNETMRIDGDLMGRLQGQAKQMNDAYSSDFKPGAGLGQDVLDRSDVIRKQARAKLNTPAAPAAPAPAMGVRPRTLTESPASTRAR